MWYKTDLMEQILTSESAKQMIDYVSPIYGKSRIGLWLFQVIGLEIDDVKTICEDIFDQIFVDRATWGLPIWEKEYGITPLPDQTIEQRRTQILQMRIKRPLNPKRFETSTFIVQYSCFRRYRIRDGIELCDCFKLL